MPFYGDEKEKDPVKIVKQALEKFKGKQVVICDTSGRSALDENLTKELKDVTGAFDPDEKLLVISADIGQIAGRQAREFDKAVKISGVLVTKMDGSGKGGGALSAANAANARAMFIGIGREAQRHRAVRRQQVHRRAVGHTEHKRARGARADRG